MKIQVCPNSFENLVLGTVDYVSVESEIIGRIPKIKYETT